MSVNRPDKNYNATEYLGWIHQAVTTVNPKKAGKISKQILGKTADEISLSEAFRFLRKSAKLLDDKSAGSVPGRISRIRAKKSLGEVVESLDTLLSRKEKQLADSLIDLGSRAVWKNLILSAKELGYAVSSEKRGWPLIAEIAAQMPGDNPDYIEKLQSLAEEDEIQACLMLQERLLNGPSKSQLKHEVIAAAIKLGYRFPLSKPAGWELIEDIAEDAAVYQADALAGLRDLYRSEPTDALQVLLGKLQGIELMAQQFQQIYREEGRPITFEVAVEMAKELEILRGDLYEAKEAWNNVAEREIFFRYRTFYLVPHGGEPPSVLLYEKLPQAAAGSFKVFHLGYGVNTADQIGYLEIWDPSGELEKETRIHKELVQQNVRNIPILLDAQLSGRRNYLLVEKMDGDFFDFWMDPGKEHDSRLLVEMGIQVGEALVDMHALGYLHLDLKPENILVAEETKTFKLTDFGFTEKLPPGRDGMIAKCGTESYVAPEIARRELATAKSDVYSFAVTLFVMRYGVFWKDPQRGVKPLGNDYSQTALAKSYYAKIQNRKLDSLDNLMMRCLASKPEHRPSMEEVVQQLKTIQLEKEGE